ncbi:MAG: hypothetical protein EYC68_02150 [Chloroflexota bacterium]|nr:MAG: hypothetical protein EYC68_02150 [Chloroflexota bacterium]
MNIVVKTGDVLREPSALGILASFEDSPLPSEVAALFDANDFRAQSKQTLLLYPRGAIAPNRLLLIGLGKRAAFTTETIRQASALAVQKARELQVPAITLGINGDVSLPADAAAQAFAEGIELGAYRYWHYRTGLSKEQT